MVGESPGSAKAPGICASSEDAVVLVDPKVLVVVLRLRDIVDSSGVVPPRYPYRLMLMKLVVVVGWREQQYIFTDEVLRRVANECP